MSNYTAEQGTPLFIKEKHIDAKEINVKLKKDTIKLMIIGSNENTYDDFIDSILKNRGWWGKTLSSVMLMFIDDYPICCYNNLNRSPNIDETIEGCKLWNYLASITSFRECFRKTFYDDSVDLDDSYIKYCKYIANIINTKEFGEEIGNGTLSRIRDGHGTCEYTGIGFLKEKWFTFDLMGSSSRIIYNDDYFNHHSSSTSVTLYDYIQYHLNTFQHIPVDINLYNRMNIWYNLYDSNIKDKIDGIIKKGELLNYRNFKKESQNKPEPEPEPESEPEPQLDTELESELESDTKPKFNIGDNVSILGSDDIKCIVEGINENEQYNYTYVLKVCNYKTNSGPIDMSEIPQLNWIPEPMIVKL